MIIVIQIDVKNAFHTFYDSIKFGASDDDEGSTIKIEDDEEEKPEQSKGCCE